MSSNPNPNSNPEPNPNPNPTPTLNPNAKDNLESIEEEIEMSSVYFRPKPEKTYVVKMDPDKIMPTENEKLKDVKGNPVKRYECNIMHVNNGREQKWTVAKTVCYQIIQLLKKGFTVLRVTRHGSDRATTYSIEGVQ